MNFTITKTLLFSHFDGHTTALQRQHIDEWATQPVNEEFYYKCLSEWELEHPQYIVDVDAAINQYKQRTTQQFTQAVAEMDTEVVVVRRFGWYRWLAAASVVLLLLSGWLFRSAILYQRFRTRPGEIRSWTLDDGSRATLNANSVLKVPRLGFNQNWLGGFARTVYLIGEAKFSVTHQPDHRQFVVKTTSQLDVVVLGTEFTVYARARRTQVVLKQGSVKILHPMGNQTRQLLMKPGDLVRLDGEKLVRTHTETPDQFAAWADQRFQFSGTSLRQIAQLLQARYGLTVRITDPEIASWTISGSFMASDVDELLQSLSKALNVQITHRGQQVTFSTPIQ